MDILADENIQSRLIELLRESGHDVWSVRENAAGIKDIEVLDTAVRMHRVLLTADKDFGALVFAEGLPAPAGIILVRLDGTDYTTRRILVRDVLNSGIEFVGRFSVIESEQVRSRALPPSDDERE